MARKARTLALGFSLALITTSAIQLALPWPPLALAIIGVVAFGAGMITGWGRWAIALGMQALIPVVFVLGFPRETYAVAFKIEVLFAVGGLAYIAFAVLATVVTDASARRLVASETIRELSMYLNAVAAVFDPETEFEQAYGSAIRQQAALSEQLQSARALLLDHVRPRRESRRLAATIGILLDAFDALVAAQSDVTRVRGASPSTPLLGHIGEALRVGALDLKHLSLEILTTDRPSLPPDHRAAIDALQREAEQQDKRDASDPAARAALTAATGRLVHALSYIRRLEKALSDDQTAEAAIGGVDLKAFLPKRSYSWSALAAAFHHRLASLSLFDPPLPCDDGGRGHRAVSWRFRSRELGPADDRGDHALQLRNDQVAPRRSRDRDADRLRRRGGRGRLAACRARWSRRRGSRSSSFTASSN